MENTMNTDRLLIVDDEKDMLAGLKRMFSKAMDNLEVITAENGNQALKIMSSGQVDIALFDIQMPEIDGLELLQKCQEMDPLLTVVMMTAYGSIETAVDAMKGGAYDFITKPFEKDTLLGVIRKALERNSLLRENRTLKERICEQSAFSEFIGQSEPVRLLQDAITTTARTDYNVLVRGESGTGKELTSRAIHQLSGRRNKKLVIVNCPAIPENLLESELFGHKKGAFTGADRDQQGLFEAANHGTICLDEIGDIPIPVQTKLLRVLQEQEIKPLGSSETKKIDVRVTALTNQDLEKKIQENSFREDLFYRLNVVTLWTPSLDSIKEDIPLLVSHFCRQVCCELGGESKFFSADAIASLVARSWPGNVRELQNVVRRAVMFCPDQEINPKHLLTPGEPIRKIESVSRQPFVLEPYKVAKEKVINQFTEQYVHTLLKKTDGNVSRAAEFSGLTRAALQKIMRRQEILSSDYRKS